MQARFVQVETAGAPLELVTRDVPEPGAGEVRVRVGGLRCLPQRFGHGRRIISVH